MIRLHEGEAYVFLRVDHAARDVVEVEINCTRVGDTDPKIALRSNWSCLSQKIWSGFGEGDAVSDKVIIARGHNFELLMKPSKSYPNKRDVNWSRHVE